MEIEKEHHQTSRMKSLLSIVKCILLFALLFAPSILCRGHNANRAVAANRAQKAHSAAAANRWRRRRRWRRRVTSSYSSTTSSSCSSSSSSSCCRRRDIADITDISEDVASTNPHLCRKY